MKEEYIRWHTPYLGGRVFEMLVFGHAGWPVILFPTSQARYYEYKDFRLVEAAAPLVDAGGIPHWPDVWRWPSTIGRCGGTCFRVILPNSEERDRS